MTAPVLGIDPGHDGGATSGTPIVLSLSQLWRRARQDGGWDVGCWESHPDDSRRAIVRWYRPVCVPDGADVRLTPDGQAWIASVAGTTICTTDADWLAWVIWRLAMRAAVSPRPAPWEAP